MKPDLFIAVRCNINTDSLSLVYLANDMSLTCHCAFWQVLRLGNLVPDFKAETTQGPMHWHEWIQGSWAVSPPRIAIQLGLCVYTCFLRAWHYLREDAEA